jgi:hypothetical protein
MDEEQLFHTCWAAFQIQSALASLFEYSCSNSECRLLMAGNIWRSSTFVYGPCGTWCSSFHPRSWNSPAFCSYKHMHPCLLYSYEGIRRGRMTYCYYQGKPTVVPCTVACLLLVPLYLTGLLTRSTYNILTLPLHCLQPCMHVRFSGCVSNLIVLLTIA